MTRSILHRIINCIINSCLNAVATGLELLKGSLTIAFLCLIIFQILTRYLVTFNEVIIHDILSLRHDRIVQIVMTYGIGLLTGLEIFSDVITLIAFVLRLIKIAATIKIVEYILLTCQAIRKILCVF